MNVILWILQIAVAFMFFSSSLTKLTAAAPHGFLNTAVGMIEGIAAVFLLLPRMTPVGALLLMLVSLGALVGHLFVIGGSASTALTLFVASAIIVYGRRGVLSRFIGGDDHKFISRRRR